MIENVSLPPEVEEALDTRTRMGVLGDLDRFTRYQAATAVTEAAANPGGLAGAGVGVGVGAGLGAQLAQALDPRGRAERRHRRAPPPLPGSTQWYLGVDGQQVGPLAPAEVKARVTAGTATNDTLVWRAGMPGWVRLGEVPELEAAPGATPPPLPA